MMADLKFTPEDVVWLGTEYMLGSKDITNGTST